MRFRNDSDEETCSKPCRHNHMLGPFACMRTSGHDGECVAAARHAGDADGVCFECRAELAGPHRDDCRRAKRTEALDELTQLSQEIGYE